MKNNSIFTARRNARIASMLALQALY